MHLKRLIGPTPHAYSPPVILRGGALLARVPTSLSRAGVSLFIRLVVLPWSQPTTPNDGENTSAAASSRFDGV